jgi:uncharacterized protein YihD (DUF1040 family)
VSDTFADKVAQMMDDEVKRFATWCAKIWTIKAADRAKNADLAELSDDYIKGYNTALEQVRDIFQTWLDEGAP